MPKVTRIAFRLKRLAPPANDAAQLRKLVRARTATVILRVASGTDRAQAAEALGRTMHRSVVRVDLGQVVSKYIGETEKNLDRLFAAAQASGAALFFDEADALFGKRSDIRDSHDRYANVEIGYLLQKIEAHSGIVVLASNQRQPLDAAFLRRLRHIVELRWPPTDE